jgi:hypothetical protein
MVAEERYPECGGPLMAGSQAGACGRCRRRPAPAAPAARPDTPLLLLTTTNAFEAGSPKA